MDEPFWILVYVYHVLTGKEKTLNTVNTVKKEIF